MDKTQKSVLYAVLGVALVAGVIVTLAGGHSGNIEENPLSILAVAGGFMALVSNGR